MRIGITGQIGAGKSTAARILQDMGAFLIDADQIGREVVETDFALRTKLSKAFGDDVIDEQGSLKRDLVALRAFSSEEGKKRLDRLVHPYLLKDIRTKMRASEQVHDVILVDATLIFDWNLEKELDLTIVIYAPQNVRLARLQKKGVPTADALARQKRQLSLREYRNRADVVIDNRGTEAELRAKLERLWCRRIAKAVDR